MKDLLVEKNTLCFSEYTDKSALANDFVQKVTWLRNKLDQCDVPLLFVVYASKLFEIVQALPFIQSE